MTSSKGLGRFIDSMTPEEAKKINAELAQFIFRTGLPFSVVDHPNFKRFVQSLRPSYMAPSRKTIATKWLDQQYNDLNSKFAAKLQAATRSKPLRFTLLTDGWTNIRGESIVNYVLVDAKGQAYFHSSDATGTASHDGDFLARELIAIIEQVGAQHINAVCTDPATNMIVAFRKVVGKYPHVYAIRCTSH